MAATTTVGSGGTHEGYRDRDPPPAFDGKEDGFKVYLRENFGGMKQMSLETNMEPKYSDNSLGRQRQ